MFAKRVTERQSAFGGLVGESAPMRRLYDLIGKISQGNSSVLILGDTGTGKELVARAIHFNGTRREHALVPVDCSALPPSLVESELFGYVKGAFTGADHSKQGLLQSANEGTVFLDEIGELPTFLQAKLLRALQEREVRPIGSTGRIPIDVRVIAATHRDLEAGIRAGTFRQDLYFRLNVVQVKLLALRQHKVDIPRLVAHFLLKFSDPLHPPHTISESGMRKLMSYDWPGNVRELENLIERAVILSPSPVLHIPLSELKSNPDGHAAGLPTLAEAEKDHIVRALEESRWVLGGPKGAAALLGMKRTTLQSRMQKLGISRPR